MLYTAKVVETEGTGVGYGMPAHVYVSGVGTAMHRSPKKALSLARRRCRENMDKDVERQLGAKYKGVGLIPVMEFSQLTLNGKLIMHKA
jgi:hypothetical protein